MAIFNLQKNHYNQASISDGTTNYFQQEQSQKQSLKMHKYIPALGFNNLVANQHYLSFVQYFGNKAARDTTGHSLVSDYFETIVNYDPWFTDAHIILSNANSVYAGNPEQTVALMNQVLQSISPEASTKTNVLWTSKGLDELLFLGDTQAAEKSYKMAAIWAQKTPGDRTQEIVTRNLQMAEFLATNPDTREAQIRAWSMVLPNIKDEAHRQRVINKIETLKAELSNSTAKP
ncbi:MAG: hypothetical protein ACFCU5_12245 [Pleurocapsa sp.]